MKKVISGKASKYFSAIILVDNEQQPPLDLERVDPE